MLPLKRGLRERQLVKEIDVSLQHVSDFRSKVTYDYSWTGGWHNLSWVSEELKRVETLKDFMEKHINKIPTENNIVVSLLKDCTIKRDLSGGTKLHRIIIKMGLLKKSLYVATALISMYAKCGVFREAHKILEGLCVQNIVAWNALISGYANQGRIHEVFDCFEQMQCESLFPNAVSFTCIVNVCAKTRAIEKGKKIHGRILHTGLLKKDILLGNALVDMYAKCGVLSKAQKVLEELLVRDMVSWSSLIAGYVEQGQGFEALNCFEQMQSEGLCADAVTLISILKACGTTKSVEKGKQIHKTIANNVTLKKDIVLGTAVVDMYVKCGALAKAEEVLKELPERDIVSWNSLIAGFSQDGKYHEVLHCLERMKTEGLSPDEVTFLCILKACGSIGAIDKGKAIHGNIVDMGFMEKNVVLGNALVDMYAKCGVLAKAQEVVDQLPIRDVVSWNALIAGYAYQGQGQEALICFEWMKNEGLSPNNITFLCILSACSRSGLLTEAQILFENMKKNYGISPNIEHQTCMVVSLGCVGRFDDAISVIQLMPSFNSIDVWLALLGSCRKWGNVELGESAFDQAIQLDYTCAAAYVLMASIFATAGMKEDAEKVDAMRLKYAAPRKQENSICVSANGFTHSFSALDSGIGDIYKNERYFSSCSPEDIQTMVRK